MASDPTKPLLRLVPQAEANRPVGRPRPVPSPDKFSRGRQTANFSPKFDRLAEVLARDPSGLELRRDPTALAPERLLVFEIRGALSSFARAIARVPGLELVDEEELAGDEADKSPIAYLMVPDLRALREIESLWRRWLAGRLQHGETPWRDVFSLLRDLRPWGPQDRVHGSDVSVLEDEIEGRGDDEPIKLEVELVFRASEETAAHAEQEVREFVAASPGRVISRSRLAEIAYHALLVELPVRAVRAAINHSQRGIAGLESVMHIRPQSIASGIEVSDTDESQIVRAGGELGEPILGLVDGVPVAAHPLLAQHMSLDDQFQLEGTTPVADRQHGTAMASLVIHGDRNKPGAPLRRKIQVVPVLGARDKFPEDRLIVDLIYSAVVAMRGDNATGPGVIIINISLGNPRRMFQGHLSAWARLLDRLAYRFGILFVVSAGNVTERFTIGAFDGQIDFEQAGAAERATETLRSVHAVAAVRRLFSPAETVNGLTVGACNEDAVDPGQRQLARILVNPYPETRLSNPSSALGPGFALAVKPDVLFPGAREHLRVVRIIPPIEVLPNGPVRAAGLRVAAPPIGGRESAEGYTNGTSAAAALASRTCHRIHDELEAAYGRDFLNLSHSERAVLLKALVVHPARWPEATADLIRGTIGPADGRLHVQQKDNIRRFIGYGIVDADDAVACAGDRATFWAVGSLRPDMIVPVIVPIPLAMRGKAQPHSLAATVAWFTPVSPGRKSYRTVRLKLLEPDGLDALSVKALRDQPDTNQTNRGTVYTRCWSGDKAPLIAANATIKLVIQRDPDQGAVVDDPIPFGLAVTVAMPGVVEIYDQVRQRLAVRQPARV